MSNYTYNKDNLKYLHHPEPVSKKEEREMQKHKKAIENLLKKERGNK